MSTFISHTLALECLRKLAASGRCPADAEERQLPDRFEEPEGLADVLALLGIGEDDAHILVSTSGNRVIRKGLRCHVWSAEVPAHAFWRMRGDVFLSSPEFCFLQMAEMLPASLLIQLGYELCGCYAMNPKAKRGFDRTRAPLTTPIRLQEFIMRAGSCRGSAKALMATRWIVANSWSPMETDTTMLLVLPTKMGGYQLPFPVLNMALRLDDDWQTRAKQGRYNLDLCWPGTKKVLEFNGEADHVGTAFAGRDRTRELVLASLGYDVTVITGRQVFRADEFDLVVQSLCKSLGRRYHKPTKAQMEKKYALRRELFARFGGNALVG